MEPEMQTMSHTETVREFETESDRETSRLVESKAHRQLGTQWS